MVGRAEGYRRFRLGGHPQHHLDQQQAREEAANLYWRFLAGTKKLVFLPIISGPRLGPEAQIRQLEERAHAATWPPICAHSNIVVLCLLHNNKEKSSSSAFWHRAKCQWMADVEVSP